MNRAVSFLHVVRGEEIGGRCQLDQQVVLEAEDGSRPDDGGLWEDASGDLLASTLGGEEFGRGAGVGIV